MFYLMIKTHKITGLKYLCKCTNTNPYKYKGSGIFWKNHLEKYGSNILDIETEVIYTSQNIKDFSEMCLKYSNEFNVKESSEWANLKEETGLDGGLTHNNPYWLNGFKHSKKTKNEISVKLKGKKRKPFTEEHKKKLSEAMKGKQMSCSLKGVPKTKAHRDKISKAQLGKKRNYDKDKIDFYKKSMKSLSNIKYKCSVCNKVGNAGQIGRYHKECMKDLTWNKIKLNENQ